MFTTFLAAVNACVSSEGSALAGGLGGPCDWRLPSITELAAIVDRTQGFCVGEVGACLPPVLGPTNGYTYWSSTRTHAGGAIWVLPFHGSAGTAMPHWTFPARAVRDAL